MINFSNYFLFQIVDDAIKESDDMELSNEAMVQSSLIQVYCPNLLSLQGSISAPSSSHFQHDDDQCKQFEDKSEHFPFPLDHQHQLQNHTITPAKLRQLAMSSLR